VVEALILHSIDPFLFMCSCHSDQEKRAAPLPIEVLGMSAVFPGERAMLLSHETQRAGCWHRVLPIWTLTIYTYDILKYGHCQDEKEVL